MPIQFPPRLEAFKLQSDADARAVNNSLGYGYLLGYLAAHLLITTRWRKWAQQVTFRGEAAVPLPDLDLSRDTMTAFLISKQLEPSLVLRSLDRLLTFFYACFGIFAPATDHDHPFWRGASDGLIETQDFCLSWHASTIQRKGPAWLGNRPF